MKLKDDGRYLSFEASGKRYLVHRAMLFAFVGPPDGENDQCRHLDGNSKRNVLDNLKWGTGTQNQYDRFDHGTARAGEENYRAVLTEEDVQKIMDLRGKTGPKAIAETLGLDTGLVKHVIYGQSWNWLTGLPRNRHRKGKHRGTQ